ncbi:hypothetical protein KCU94_g230, partial [Aureobasidium melanogenum]
MLKASSWLKNSLSIPSSSSSTSCTPPNAIPLPLWCTIVAPARAGLGELTGFFLFSQRTVGNVFIGASAGGGVMRKNHVEVLILEYPPYRTAPGRNMPLECLTVVDIEIVQVLESALLWRTEFSTKHVDATSVAAPAHSMTTAGQGRVRTRYFTPFIRVDSCSPPNRKSSLLSEGEAMKVEALLGDGPETVSSVTFRNCSCFFAYSARIASRSASSTSLSSASFLFLAFFSVFLATFSCVSVQAVNISRTDKSCWLWRIVGVADSELKWIFAHPVKQTPSPPSCSSIGRIDHRH